MMAHSIAQITGATRLRGIRTLIFLSRHEPSPAQIALARRLGYESLRRIDLVFGNDPVADLARAGILASAPIAVVGPGHVILALLRCGFTIIEFANDPRARAEGRFECAGVWRHRLISSTYVPRDVISR